MNTQEKEDYALDLIKTYGGNVEHALNSVNRLIASAESDLDKERLTEIANQIIKIKEKVGRVVKKKCLIYEPNLQKSWAEFLGGDYNVVVGQLISDDKGGFSKVYDAVPMDKNGVLFVEYKHKESDATSIILQNEWFYQINKNIRHLTDYTMANYSKFFDDELNLINQ
jgi:hypothetical protein